MGSFFWMSEDHVEYDGEDGCHNKDFEHEVVESGPEERTPRFGHEGSAVVVAKLLGSLGEILTCKACFEIRFELCNDFLNACINKIKSAYHRAL